MSTNTVSKAKRRANRRNAKKSTGPKTPEGKQRSSRNAIKHGLLARHVVLADDPNEKPADFDQILEGLFDDFDPKNTIQRLLVERIAASYWRLRRAFRYEVQAIRDRRQDDANPLQQLSQQILGARPDPDRHLLPGESALNRLLRYESMIDRELNRSLRQLHHLQRTIPDIVPQPDTDASLRRLAPSRATGARPQRRPAEEAGAPGSHDSSRPSPPLPVSNLPPSQAGTDEASLSIPHPPHAEKARQTALPRQRDGRPPTPSPSPPRPPPPPPPRPPPPPPPPAPGDLPTFPHAHVPTL